MRKLALALLACCWLAPAQAQQVDWPPPAGTIAALGVYNASPPTITTGKPAYLQIDSTGGLRVSLTGSGGAITIADGADVALGAKADTVCAIATGACSLIALQKYANNALGGAIPAGTNTIGAVNNPYSNYETVAASQTGQALGATGATGDYLSHCVVTPGTTSPGVVTVLDNAVSVVAFPGGASSVSNLVPFTIPIGALSVSGAWKITTGANVTVVCMGKFT